MVDPRFTHDEYLLRMKVFKIFGEAFHIYNPDGSLAFYSKLKAFKLREDIRLYTDESMATELLSISARNVIDFSAAYDVFDSASGETVGTLRRRGFKSMIRDEWEILDAHGQPVGMIQEDSTALALIRRFVEAASLFLPQKYHAEMSGQPVATFQQNFNPFVKKLTLNFTDQPAGTFDRRLGLAAGVLLLAIEGRQD